MTAPQLLFKQDFALLVLWFHSRFA